MPKNPFEYQQPDRDQVQRIERVRGHLRDVYETIMIQCPHSAERTLALRKLEEASMWANKSIVMEEEQCVATRLTSPFK